MNRSRLSVSFEILARTIIGLSLVSAILINAFMVRIATESPLDFGSFVASSQNIKNAANPYSDASPLIYEIYFPEAHTGGKLPNLNPPLLLVLLEALPEASPVLLANWWRSISILLYATSLLLIIREYPNTTLAHFLWLVALAGFWHTIELGQIYILLLLILVLAWTNSLRGHNRCFGILLGLLASIKPNFFIWILFVGLSRNWRAVLYAGIALALSSALPIAVYGPEVYAQWWQATQVGRAILGMPGNSSLIGLASAFGSSRAGLLLSAIFMVLLIFFTYSRISQQIPDARLKANQVGILGSLLASPISWAGYTLFVIPIFISRSRWSTLLLLAAAILSVPFILVLALYEHFASYSAIWGWFYGFGLILILVDQLTQPSAETGLIEG